MIQQEEEGINSETRIQYCIIKSRSIDKNGQQHSMKHRDLKIWTIELPRDDTEDVALHIRIGTMRQENEPERG